MVNKGIAVKNTEDKKTGKKTGMGIKRGSIFALAALLGVFAGFTWGAGSHHSDALAQEVQTIAGREEEAELMTETEIVPEAESEALPLEGAGDAAAAAEGVGAAGDVAGDASAEAALEIPEMEIPDFGQMCRQLEKMLEEENESVAFQATAVTAAPGYEPASQEEAGAGDGSEDGIEVEGPSGPDREQFLSDIKDAYAARLSVLRRYAAFPEMKEETYNTYRFLCAEAERPFYEAYTGAEFVNKNMQFLCDRYLQGLKAQYDAEALWHAGADRRQIEALYFEGYDLRASVLLELNAFYLEEGALEETEALESTQRIDTIVEKAIEKNDEVSSDLVMRVQEGLNEAGYDCGTPDGDAGRNTVLAICHYQMAQGEEPDGVADEELAEALGRPAGEEEQ